SGVSASINWTAWKDVGMAARGKVNPAVLETAGVLSVEAALAAFHDVLRRGSGQWVVVGRATDFSALTSNTPPFRAAAASELPREEPSAPAGRDTQDVTQRLELELLQLLSNVVQVNGGVHAESNFRELGLESVAFIELSEKIRRQLGIDIDPPRLFAF